MGFCGPDCLARPRSPGERREPSTDLGTQDYPSQRSRIEISIAGSFYVKCESKEDIGFAIQMLRLAARRNKLGRVKTGIYPVRGFAAAARLFEEAPALG